MKKVLVINSSARLLNSQSRQLAAVFIDHWKSIHSNPVISLRELGNAPVPHINEAWITAAAKPQAIRSEEEIAVLRTSDVFIAELRAADLIVLAAPMYNWSIPSTLKAYIDHIFRVNETWRLNPNDPQSYIGLLENKTLLLLLSRGSKGYEPGEPSEQLNFQNTYLKTVFNIMGINNIHVIAINGVSLGPRVLEQSTSAARQQLKAFIEKELE
ncbi:NAD(P)H dehydrogenase [Chitinophaga agrisoli]|uniref:FMN dependent NADH:quinone oxidoreductase n=1 Tax=Chitinophaga agrisoli TaxID=2607653 RepID=A0A5B2VNQ7_9BACT|nr:NAD(P)H-dependent oxidoreductase [Chitinophaga agrisoli]KAA2241313.1 NAD(P)H dehydrogenase [Chitinophaga agrisoli]